jgi:hypothetical protein
MTADRDGVEFFTESRGDDVGFGSALVGHAGPLTGAARERQPRRIPLVIGRVFD